MVFEFLVLDDIMILITTVHIQMQIQANTYSGRLCCSGTNSFINFWLRFCDTRRHNSYYADYPQHAAHLVVVKLSVGRDLKNLNHHRNGRELNSLPTWSNLSFQLPNFQNPQILSPSLLGMMSSTLQPISRLGFIMTMVIVISFAHERKPVPNDYAPELLTRIVQSPTKLNISNKKWLI